MASNPPPSPPPPPPPSPPPPPPPPRPKTPPWRRHRHRQPQQQQSGLPGAQAPPSFSSPTSSAPTTSAAADNSSTSLSYGHYAGSRPTIHANLRHEDALQWAMAASKQPHTEYEKWFFTDAAQDPDLNRQTAAVGWQLHAGAWYGEVQTYLVPAAVQSITVMETRALGLALERAQQLFLRPELTPPLCLASPAFMRRVRIFTDSKDALMAVLRLFNGYGDSHAGLGEAARYVYHNYHALQRTANGVNVEMFWCPGHKGVPGNELADELARRGKFQGGWGPGTYSLDGGEWKRIVQGRMMG